jgi:hypothetical protein
VQVGFAVAQAINDVHGFAMVGADDLRMQRQPKSAVWPSIVAPDLSTPDCHSVLAA